MIKIITLANLQLFLTKCKTLFASKKHTHTASEITGLPSGGGADSTRYTVDEHGYTVIKDKNGTAFLEVKESKATLTHAKEVLLESEAGSGTSLRLSEKDVHLDGIDGGMMVESRESLSGEICYGMNLPLKNSSTDTNPTTQPIKGICLHKTYVELTGPDNSIYGDAIYLGGSNSNIDVDAGGFNFTNTDTTIIFNGYSIPSLFPNRAIPNIHSLLSQVTNAIISVPDEELTYGYMYGYSEGICVFHNESHTMYFLKDGDVIQPLSIPVFNSVEEALAVLDTDTQLLYAKNPNTGVFELMYNSGVSGSGFEMVYLDKNPQESVGYDKIVNITNAFLKLKELSEKI